MSVIPRTVVNRPILDQDRPGRPRFSWRVRPQESAISSQEVGDAPDVILGLWVGRHAAIPGDGGFAGVIAGYREPDVAIMQVEQPAEVARARHDVLPRIERIGHPEL